MNRIARQIIFVGSVQDVGFRFTVLSIANRYRLTGLVRNLPDGTVEAIAQGPASDIDDCTRDIKESFDGHIRETRIEDIPIDPQYTDFKITF